MSGKKAPEGWTFTESESKGTLGTRRDPSNPTVEQTVHGTSLEEAHEMARDRDAGIEMRERAGDDDAQARAEWLRENARRVENGEPEIPYPGVEILTDKQKQELEEDGLVRQQRGTLVGS